MAYSHTNLAIDSKLDIVSRYSEFVEVTSNGENMYVCKIRRSY